MQQRFVPGCAGDPQLREAATKVGVGIQASDVGPAGAMDEDDQCARRGMRRLVEEAVAEEAARMQEKLDNAVDKLRK